MEAMPEPRAPSDAGGSGAGPRLQWTVLLPLIALGLGSLGEFVLHGPVPAALLLATLATGRTTVLQGGIHLVIFAAFLTISAVP
jgi:hypothetical protein